MSDTADTGDCRLDSGVLVRCASSASPPPDTMVSVEVVRGVLDGRRMFMLSHRSSPSALGLLFCGMELFTMAVCCARNAAGFSRKEATVVTGAGGVVLLLVRESLLMWRTSMLGHGEARSRMLLYFRRSFFLRVRFLVGAV